MFIWHLGDRKMDQNTDNPSPINENQPQPNTPQESQPVAEQPQTPPQSESVAPEQPPVSEPPTAEPAEDISKDAKMWGMFCHLAALAGYLGIPFGNVLGPLIIWLIKKDDFKFVNDQGTESLNFQISITIYSVVAGLLVCLGGLGIFLLIPLWIFDLIMVIIASISANKGTAYRYPLCIRLIK